MAEKPETTEEGASPSVRSRNFPLNLRRLTLPIVTQIARALSLPNSGTLSDTTQMVEGTLTRRSLEPRNVQVVMHEVEGGRAPEIEICNDDGIIVQIEAELGADPGSRTVSHEPSLGITRNLDDGARETEQRHELESVKRMR